MAVTTDIRLDRIRHEYTGLRDTQDALMDRIDTYEAALLGLTDAVSRNGERLDAVEQRLDAVEQRLGAIEQRLGAGEQRLDAIEHKLDALMAHLKVPYKPPAGFVKE